MHYVGKSQLEQHIPAESFSLRVKNHWRVTKEFYKVQKKIKPASEIFIRYTIFKTRKCNMLYIKRAVNFNTKKNFNITFVVETSELQKRDKGIQFHHNSCNNNRMYIHRSIRRALLFLHSAALLTWSNREEIQFAKLVNSLTKVTFITQLLPRVLAVWL